MNGRIRCVSELLTRIQLVSRNAPRPCVYTRPRIRITQVVPLSRVAEKCARLHGKKVGADRGGRRVHVHFRRLLRNVIWIFDSFRVVTWLRYYDFRRVAFVWRKVLSGYSSKYLYKIRDDFCQYKRCTVNVNFVYLGLLFSDLIN